MLDPSIHTPFLLIAVFDDILIIVMLRHKTINRALQQRNKLCIFYCRKGVEICKTSNQTF